MLKLIIHYFREIRENQKSKARKTRRSRWGQPKEREREKKQSRDAKAITHYLPQADRPLGLWAITLERQNSGFAAAHDVIGYPIPLTLSGISFWPPEIHYSGRVFSQLPAHPQPTYWGGQSQKQKVSLQTLLSNSQGTGVTPTLLWAQIWPTAPQGLLWRLIHANQT